MFQTILGEQHVAEDYVLGWVVTKSSCPGRVWQPHIQTLQPIVLLSHSCSSYYGLQEELWLAWIIGDNLRQLTPHSTTNCKVLTWGREKMQIDTSYKEYSQVPIYIAQCTITVASVRLTQAQYNYVYVAYKFTYCCTMTLSQLSGCSSLSI